MKEMVGLTGLEPVTSSLSGKRSNRLSYRPVNRGVTLPDLRRGRQNGVPADDRPSDNPQRSSSASVSSTPPSSAADML